MSEDTKEYDLLPHHEQQTLCSTRLPYRQGRKLTAVKVYSINNESRHLLVFGVPSLNLRQETKALFLKFGKLQLNTTKYPSEQFTETFHAVYENIQSARLAKKMLDTKNFYGGVLHICYAPELESIEDTKEKLLLRQKNVLARLKNLQKSTSVVNEVPKLDIQTNVASKNLEENKNKIYMGEVNSIDCGKRKATDYKSVKHCKLKKKRHFDRLANVASNQTSNEKEVETKSDINKQTNVSETSNAIEVVDFTSVETEILTNINESLNYNNFGQELIKPVPYKPVNKIKFTLNKNT